MVSGKRVLVTGASVGIGEQIAYHYARMGASVVVTARRERRLKQVVKKCTELGSQDATFTYIVADMGNLDDTSRVIEKAVVDLGGLDQLILNHAWISGVDRWSGSQHNLTMLHGRMNVNFFSFVHLASHALPHLMSSDGAAISVVSSVAGRAPLAHAAAYSASKFALDGFFSSLTEELLRHGNNNITFTLCLLGHINTEVGYKMMKEFYYGIGIDFDAATQFWIRLASPEDTAFAIIRSTSLGEPEMYYPSSQGVKQLVQLRHISVRLLFKAIAMLPQI